MKKLFFSFFFIISFPKNLTPEFRRALTRIFRICDKDGDNLLKDNELIEIQSDVFKGELTQGDIKGIKDVIKDDVTSILRDLSGKYLILDGKGMDGKGMERERNFT